MQDQITELKIAMATQQTIEAERWSQITKLLQEIKDEQHQNRNEVSELKQQMALGRGALKLVGWAGALVGLLLGLMKLFEGSHI